MADVEETYLTDLAHISDLVKSPSGDLDIISGLRNLHQSLYHRLITQPGSLIHRPDYGIGMKTYQNAVNSIDTQRRLAARIDEQFRQDFRVQEVSGIRISSERDTPDIVKLFVRIKAIGYDEVELKFAPFGEG
jgi:hypothetical protein